MNFNKYVYCTIGIDVISISNDSCIHMGRYLADGVIDRHGADAILLELVKAKIIIGPWYFFELDVTDDPLFDEVLSRLLIADLVGQGFSSVEWCCRHKDFFGLLKVIDDSFPCDCRKVVCLIHDHEIKETLVDALNAHIRSASTTCTGN